jgi:signal transduction histidine kinase
VADRHPLLARQVRRHLGDPGALPEAWRPFLDAVGEAYAQYDMDVERVARSLELMSLELTERNRELSEQLHERVAAEQALQQEKAEQAVLIGKLEEAQSQLLQSEKLASIGQLAAGVAHEINNPIGFVHSNLGTLERYIGDLFRLVEACGEAEAGLPAGTREALAGLKEELDLPYLKEDVPALLRESKDGIVRVRKIVQDLKDFSRLDSGQDWQLADLRQGLESTLNIVHNEIKYKADVVKAFADIPAVECLPSQLNQVFMNLMVNAAHAIEGARGTITLRTGRRGDDQVWVEVADTGMGIPEDMRNKIFDPFFTTKPVGQGTGLGLSLAYGIVRKHHGHFELESEPGKGTTFRIVLPVKQPAEAVPDPNAP